MPRKFFANYSVNNGTTMSFPLEYRNYRQPTYVTIISASSYYANYYTGGAGSTLWLDELEFRYD